MGGGTEVLFGLVFPLYKYYYQKQDEINIQSIIRCTSPDHLKIVDIIDIDHVVAVEAINLKIIWFSPQDTVKMAYDSL